MHLGGNLRDTREQKQLTQQDIATQIGITAAAICHYEKGKRVPPIDKLAHMASLYGTTVDNLLK